MDYIFAFSSKLLVSHFLSFSTKNWVRFWLSCFDVLINLRRIDILTILSFLNMEYLVMYKNLFKCLSAKFCHFYDKYCLYFVKFILKYFVVLDINAKEPLKILFSTFLLIHKNAISFYIKILYPMVLLNSHISSRSCFVNSSGRST